MLFATNRSPAESVITTLNRAISFDLNNTSANADMYFCERKSKGNYVEIGSQAFFKRLKEEEPLSKQLLFYIHGFNNTSEQEVFPNALKLQALMDQVGGKDFVKVVPLLWPTDDDNAFAIMKDYWDDQKAADKSGTAFGRMLGKFDGWRGAVEQQEAPCTRRINILAHSMGNRVLSNALSDWVNYDNHGEVPLLFRNIFMVAPDLENEALENGGAGQYIPYACRNAVVYYASDDLAMPASKVLNLKHRRASRRLGMTGPENLSKLPNNVYEVDCDDFNNSFDPPQGHTYFLDAPDKTVSPIIHHMVDAIKNGRVSPKDQRQELEKPEMKSK